MKRIPVLLLGLLLFACGFLAGCPVFSHATATLTPPEEIAPEFEFEKDDTVLVLVDDLKSGRAHPQARFELSRYLSEGIEEHTPAEKVISPKRLQWFRASDPRFNGMSVAEIGEKLDASIVVVVELSGFSLKDYAQATFWNPNAEALVRVVSVKEGRLWPRDLPGGHPIGPVTLDPSDDTGPYQEQVVCKELSELLGEKILNLFREHRKSDHIELPERESTAGS
jgi:hypothetical protein